MSPIAVGELDALFRAELPPRPYPGLRPFEKPEWPIFFGRERMADAVVTQLLRDHFLVVHGDSGCGKSSLIRAGVLPKLEQENARRGCRWRTCVATPGEAPLWNLAQALADLDDTQSAEERGLEIRRILNSGVQAGPALAALLRQASDDSICILLDQFEELFDHARRHGPDEARMLTDVLVGLSAQRPEGLYAVLTMRSEFLGACARFRGLAECVNATQYLLPRMGHRELLRAIREPALLYGGSVSRELADRLIADSGADQDQLPLIQHGLMLLHRQSTRTRPTAAGAADPPPWHIGLEHYGRDRGLDGLLSDHADAVMEAAQRAHIGPGDPPRLVEDLFRALTDINAEGHAIRRPQRLGDLMRVTGAGERTLRNVIDAFRADGVSFLRPYGDAPLAADDRIDVSHEALIRCWRRIADPEDGWLIREFRNGLVWRALLVQADSFDRDPSNVLAPTTTDERELWVRRRNPAWAERYGGGWDRVQRLLAASARERDRKRAEQTEAARREARLRRRTAGLIVTTLLVLVTTGLGSLAWREAHEARIQFERSETARAHSEALMQEAEQAARELRTIVAEMENALAQAERDTGDPDPVQWDQAVRRASEQISAQAFILERPAPAPARSPPAEAAAGTPPRVFIHIAAESQRAAARDFERQLGARTLDGLNLITPGVELVSVSPRRSELRCFRAAECREDGDRLLELANGLLQRPQFVLRDLSARYGESSAISARHFEIWFAPGDVIELKSSTTR
jgi:hypothetical protein